VIDFEADRRVEVYAMDSPVHCCVTCVCFTGVASSLLHVVGVVQYLGAALGVLKSYAITDISHENGFGIQTLRPSITLAINVER
jgi:hypothetical protein